VAARNHQRAAIVARLANDVVNRMNLRASLELARLSNSPTIVSNVLVGAAIAHHGQPTAFADMPWPTIALVTLAMLLFYVGGMAMNDAVDARIDRHERPNRPIPSGRISPRAAWTYIVITFALALAILASCGIAPVILGTILLLTITLYNILHKHFPPSIMLMGLCRMLVYLTAASAMLWPLELESALPPAIAITFYVAIVTFIARGESGAPSAATINISRRLAMLIVLIAVAPSIVIFPDHVGPLIVSVLALIGWLVLLQRHLLQTPPRIKPAIMGWLAGICLLDAFYLTLLDQPLFAAIAGACFVVTILAHRAIAGT
jgi:4-hydroxybenzoate polyprenyltransferase